MRVACWIGLMLWACSAMADPPSTDNAAVVMGEVIEGGVPLSGVQVFLTRQSEDGASQQAETDAQGRYRFESVAPGEYMVGRSSRVLLRRSGSFTYMTTPTYTRWIFVEPGATLDVPLVPTGHTLRGRLVVPKDCPIKIAWQGCSQRRLSSSFSWPEPPATLPEAEHDAWFKSYRQSLEYKAARKDDTIIVVDVHPDGSFEAAHVPPGGYSLFIEIADDGTDVLSDYAGAASTSFTMPDADFTLPDLEAKLREGIGSAASK
jgi:hypothetical protein